MNYLISKGLSGLLVYGYEYGGPDDRYAIDSDPDICAIYTSGGKKVWNGFRYYDILHWVDLTISETVFGALITKHPDAEMFPNLKNACFVLNKAETAFCFIDDLMDVVPNPNFTDFNECMYSKLMGEESRYKNPTIGFLGDKSVCLYPSAGRGKILQLP